MKDTAYIAGRNCNMNVVLYDINTDSGKVAENWLKIHNIQYKKVTSKEELIENNITLVPTISIDNIKYNFPKEVNKMKSEILKNLGKTEW